METKPNLSGVTLDPTHTVTMSRRQLINGLASGSVVAFTAASAAGCATNAATGANQLMLVSDGQLAQLAASAWEQQRRETPLAGGVPQARVDRVGRRIVDAAAQRYPNSNVMGQNWEFAAFNDDSLNAYAMPGGKVGFYTGILDIMENDDQVAAVMGHEVGHVVGRHAAERYSQTLAAQAGLIAANVALADQQYGREIAGVLGAGVMFGVILPYSRRHELESDRLGVDMMATAGYRPREALTFWERMAAQNANRSRPPEWLSTHPSDATRIAALQAHLANMGYS